MQRIERLDRVGSCAEQDREAKVGRRACDRDGELMQRLRRWDGYLRHTAEGRERDPVDMPADGTGLNRMGQLVEEHAYKEQRDSRDAVQHPGSIAMAEPALPARPEHDQ